MNHRDIQLVKKIIFECKDITRYVNEVGEKGFLENDVYQKATAMSLLNIGEPCQRIVAGVMDGV